MKQERAPGRTGEARTHRKAWRRHHYRLFAYTFLLVASLLAAVAGAILYTHAKGETAALEIREANVLELATSTLSGRLETVVSDLLFLKDNLALRRFIVQGDSWGLRDLAVELRAFGANKGYYRQLRFIDEHGSEIVRIDQLNRSGPAVIQRVFNDRSDQDYFKEAMRLDAGTVYLSRFDLADEGTDPAAPPTPVLRVASPVDDALGRKRGILILDYRASEMVERLKTALSGAVGETMLLDEDGHWMVAPDPQDSWGHARGHERTFDKPHADAWSAIQQGGRGSVDVATGRFTFLSLSPRGLVAEVSRLAGSVGAPADPAYTTAYRWILVSRLPAGLLAAVSEGARRLMLIGSFASLVVAAVVSWLIAGARTVRAAADDELARHSEHLAELVEERTRELVTITDNLPAGIMQVDKDERVVFINKTGRDWLGMPETEVLGQSLREVFGPAEYERRLPHIETVRSGKGVEFAIETHYPAGAARELEITYVPRMAADGVVQGFFTLAIDHTERNLLEEHLRQSQKLQAIGQLTGGVAHDFNNLLGVLVGNAELLESAVAGNTAAQRNVASIIRAAERGASLTQRLLSFARQQTLTPKPTAIGALVLELEDILRRTLGETIKFQTHVRSGSSEALIDAHQLENALLNLTLNARDAMPRGGLLTIETDSVALDQSIAAQYGELKPGNYVKITVADNGDGMAPEVLDKVFEPFFTTKEVGAGSGLGLSMVYGFAMQSGGHITIDSQHGRGTTVSLFLPQTDAPRAQEDRDTPDVALPRGSERILIVEDDEDLRDIPKHILLAEGYEVLVAGTGAEALAILESEKQPIDLLFSDVVLPGGMTGVDITREAKRLRPAMKVLLTTGYAESASLEIGELGGGAKLLHKPYKRTELLERVRTVLDEADQAT